MAISLKDMDNRGSGYGTLLILFPVVVIVILGALNYAVFDVPMDNSNVNEIVFYNTSKTHNANWWEAFIEIWSAWIHNTIGGMTKILDGLATVMHYLVLDIPLVANIAPYDNALRAILGASLIIGIVEIAWIGG